MLKWRRIVSSVVYSDSKNVLGFAEFLFLMTRIQSVHISIIILTANPDNTSGYSRNKPCKPSTYTRLRITFMQLPTCLSVLALGNTFEQSLLETVDSSEDKRKPAFGYIA